MFKILNNDFKILSKYKMFLDLLDNILENVPRKDMYYKDKIRDIASSLLMDILVIDYSEMPKYEEQLQNVKAKIGSLDFMLERLFIKKYISEKALYNVTYELIQINKMVTGWVNNKIKVADGS